MASIPTIESQISFDAPGAGKLCQTVRELFHLTLSLKSSLILIYVIDFRDF
jgi:hypothetical protein